MKKIIEGEGILTLIDGIRYGDDIVFQTEEASGYRIISESLLAELTKSGHSIHHITFYNGPDNLNLNLNGENVIKHYVSPDKGFEAFVEECCDIVFSMEFGDIVFIDCLTSLMSFWGSDWLIGYAYHAISEVMKEREVTSFIGIVKKCHRHFTIKKVVDSATVVVRVMRDNVGRHCLLPRKAAGRQSHVMYKPFILDVQKSVRPIADNVEAMEIITPPDKRSDMQYYQCLDRLFLGGAENNNDPEAVKSMCVIMMGQDKKILELASQYFTLSEMKLIRRRTIGSGYIGGKATGMLVARKIIKEHLPDIYEKHSEPDDSYFLGADVFYTFMIYNGLWDDYKSFLNSADVVKAKKLHRLIMNAKMPPEVLERMEDIIDYFGHYPIIARSSSLLEDSFESSFAGKYESKFCILTGDEDNMRRQLSDIFKAVYASMFSQEAVKYRRFYEIKGRSDIMSIIIQRVSGVFNGNYYFPHLAGVGQSYNSYIWDKKIDPESGLIRLVSGLGTKAVDNEGGDYARMIALNRPHDYPMPGVENRRAFCQRAMEVVDTYANKVREIKPADLYAEVDTGPFMKYIAARDFEIEKKLNGMINSGIKAWYISHDHVIQNTNVLETLGKIMKALERAYEHPVEIEFTINFKDDQKYRINILQCRPVQVQRIGNAVVQGGSASEYEVFRAKGTFLGGSNSLTVDTVVYVDWDEYIKLSSEDKRYCAEIIGILNDRVEDKGLNCLLMGYGRWGSSVTALGVPVVFSQIDSMKAVIEIGHIEKGMVPELSYGTHFFHDVVESKISYISVLDNNETFHLSNTITKRHNMIRKALPDTRGFEKVIKYYRFPKRPLRLVTDISSNEVALYRSKRL